MVKERILLTKENINETVTKLDKFIGKYATITNSVISDTLSIFDVNILGQDHCIETIKKTFSEETNEDYIYLKGPYVLEGYEANYGDECIIEDIKLIIKKPVDSGTFNLLIFSF